MKKFERTKNMSCFFINLWVITVHTHRTAYELVDLFLEEGADINAPLLIVLMLFVQASLSER